MTDQIVQRDSAETADPGVIQEILDKNPTPASACARST